MGRRTRIFFLLAVGSLALSARASTILTVNKSGNDVLLSWTSAGAPFSGARATDGPFANTTTFFTGFGGTSYTYVGAMANGQQLEFFDISDETESNRGGNWNGGLLPPPPPVINPGGATNIGSLFIGSTGTIDGSGFSSVPGNNTVCFKGGVCTEAISASASQVQFVTPPGALSGPVTVTVGQQTSATQNATVTLEDPATGWLIRTMGFSRQDKSYWMGGTAAGVTSLYRVFYDNATGKWLREDRGGAFSGQSAICSTQTTRQGTLACGYGTLDTAGGVTRTASTSPPGNLTQCFNLGGVGNSTNVRGAAADPNPNAVAGRDVLYFAHADNTNAVYRVKKVSADCITLLDADYGATNWNGMWGAIVGMAVDPITGDLYMATTTTVQRITPSETVQFVRGGFTSISGLDVFRSGPNDPGVLLVADAGTSNTVKAVALDNTTAAPISVATAANLRAAAFGASVSGGPWDGSNVNRVVVIHNNGNTGAVGPLRPYPLIDVTPAGPLRVRISSPLASEQAPAGQSRVRPSTFQDTSYSQAVTELRYTDGLSRLTCAWTGDPGKSAPYETNPAAANCNKPRTLAASSCDNQSDLMVGGPGSFVEAGSPLVSCKTCGGTAAPCRWEFRITNRFAGDNYKTYYGLDSGASEFQATSDIYTAWKHIHLERDRMCKVGGLLFRAYGAPGECGGAAEPACCGTGSEPPCNQIVLYGPTLLQQNQSVTIFDAIPYKAGATLRTFEQGGETRTVSAPPVNNGDGTVTVTLSPALAHSYVATDPVAPPPAPPLPAFTNGHSAGVCVGAGGFWEADASAFAEPYDDAFTTAHTPVYGLSGAAAGTTPFVPAAFLNSDTSPCTMRRLSRIWFGGFAQGASIGNCPDPPANIASPNNHFHLNGADSESRTPVFAGVSFDDGNFLYVYGSQIAIDCSLTTGGCTPATKEGNMTRWVTSHECAHQFQVDKCSPFFHDSRPAWCGSAGGACVDATLTEEKCLMYGGATPGRDFDLRANGIDHFCAEDLVLGDPNCSGTPRPGAIRTWEDPQ